VHLGAEGLQRCIGHIRTGMADDLVPSLEKFGDNGAPDVAGRSGDGYLHGNASCRAVPQVRRGERGVLMQSRGVLASVPTPLWWRLSIVAAEA
jgi:hypothetical protein